MRRPTAQIALSDAVTRQYMEMLMTTGTCPYYSEFFREVYAEGMAIGLRTMLTARGFDVSEALASEIDECTDPTLLIAWITRAATAETLDEVFCDQVQ
ncbi:hypothetical protein OHA40_01875 [Nocardia sp. NBC_00508]|uniref:hypothetical protein n=1 Tax=Nocardia sp. NBC_00508 TaxID=2975992 RepID=UPI002E809AA8|nr:hypothetical protein [Nocardia sp. NBC_00508]WUD66943.1 hypothetical protein OHA40_01875 [Nocardia sp. NBC_00508]